MTASPGNKTVDPTADHRRRKKVSRAPGFLRKSEHKATPLLIITLLATQLALASCTSITQRPGVRPLVMRDVPAQRLAYRFEPDVGLPAEIKNEETNDKIDAIQTDFDTRRQNDALTKIVRSPDGQRVLVLYSGENEPSQTFHIDLYAADGKFLRNITPPDLACAFPENVAWSPDGNFITFVGHRAAKPTPTPTPPGAQPPETVEATPLPSVAPVFAPVALFDTEQIYICNRDGYDLKPLTTREGLIYFYSAWAPDSHALVAMACKESEWDAREKQNRLPSGRPRLISLEGKERLLDDGLTEALPVWSPDSSKIADAFEADVMIYDAATEKPTQARIRLEDQLIAASRAYEQKIAGPNKENHNQPASTSSAIPVSMNPIVRLEWPTPEKLYLHTAYVRLYAQPINTFQRWHLLTLSPQAAVLK